MEINEFIDGLFPEEETVTADVVETDSRPFLTTPFEEYTVTEGLLLLVLLVLFVFALVKLLKEGFYWLL